MPASTLEHVRCHTLRVRGCRYEDDGWAWAGHRLAVGVLLGRVAAHTVDEQGKPAFVTANVLLLLRKVRAVCLPTPCPSWQRLCAGNPDLRAAVAANAAAAACAFPA